MKHISPQKMESVLNVRGWRLVRINGSHHIWKNEDGCLVIKSPYIKDPAGFATADLVDIHSDGRFILKGRSDSIVKIEEKRV